VHEIINTAINNTHLLIHQRKGNVHTFLKAQKFRLQADKVHLTNIIFNLIDNAIKYSKNEPEITISTYNTAEGIMIQVKDNGIGISKENQRKIFDKFYRHYRSQGQASGTGLGLYLAKSLVTAHHGNLWVRSREGQGSTFGFTVQPFSQLAANEKSTDNSGIVRYTHGWIKNHSLYRR
jgi:two-component system phosphate regulon sensor histidine kinase PhoR